MPHRITLNAPRVCGWLIAAIAATIVTTTTMVGAIALGWPLPVSNAALAAAGVSWVAVFVAIAARYVAGYLAEHVTKTVDRAASREARRAARTIAKRLDRLEDDNRRGSVIDEAERYLREL